MTSYNDPTVPYWRGFDIEQLFTAHAHRPERARAWLDWRCATDSGSAVMMRGKFELGLLAYHCFTWTFTPSHKGGLAISDSEPPADSRPPSVRNNTGKGY